MNRVELELLELLSNRVRFLSLAQIARGWFEGQRHAGRQAAQLTRKLAQFGWLEVTDIFARSVAPLSAPLCRWRHAEPMPDFVALSQHLHQRASLPAAQTTIVRATAKARTLLSGGGTSKPRIKLTQATHDLQVAEICLHFVRAKQNCGSRWVSEDALPNTWPIPQRPDALLVDGDDQPVRAVEYGGDYSYQRLYEFHFGLASIPIPYEIW